MPPLGLPGAPEPGRPALPCPPFSAPPAAPASGQLLLVCSVFRSMSWHFWSPCRGRSGASCSGEGWPAAPGAPAMPSADAAPLPPASGARAEARKGSQPAPNAPPGPALHGVGRGAGRGLGTGRGAGRGLGGGGAWALGGASVLQAAPGKLRAAPRGCGRMPTSVAPQPASSWAILANKSASPSEGFCCPPSPRSPPAGFCSSPHAP